MRTTADHPSKGEYEIPDLSHFLLQPWTERPTMKACPRSTLVPGPSDGGSLVNTRQRSSQTTKQLLMERRAQSCEPGPLLFTGHKVAPGARCRCRGRSRTFDQHAQGHCHRDGIGEAVSESPARGLTGPNSTGIRNSGKSFRAFGVVGRKRGQRQRVTDVIMAACDELVLVVRITPGIYRMVQRPACKLSLIHI